MSLSCLEEGGLALITLSLISVCFFSSAALAPDFYLKVELACDSMAFDQPTGGATKPPSIRCEWNERASVSEGLAACPHYRLTILPTSYIEGSSKESQIGLLWVGSTG
jgi:hypothetical protein